LRRPSFRCALDGAAPSSCTSPKTYSGLSSSSHTFAVYAVSRRISSQAASVTWTVNTQVSTGPSVPTGLTATPGNAQVALSWNASTAAAGIAGYRVDRNGTQVAQVNGTTYTDVGLINGIGYTYTVAAVDTAGTVSAPSASVSATPGSSGSSGSGGQPPPIQAWVPSSGSNFAPLSDQQAAANVIPAPETVAANAQANNTTPTSAQLQSFYGTSDLWGRNVVAVNPYFRYVTGHYTGTTDEIIQWTAWKWGIPEDWLRAQYVQESLWKQAALGDLATVTASQYSQYPSQARVPGTLSVYQSMGISQVKWTPDGRVGAGTEPMRWQSTAFNADYEAATIRFYFDDPGALRSAWGDPSYNAGNAWDSLGGWFSSYPWLNPGQLRYITLVQARLAARTWTLPGF
jgi:chitodextrinase